MIHDEVCTARRLNYESLSKVATYAIFLWISSPLKEKMRERERERERGGERGRERERTRVG